MKPIQTLLFLIAVSALVAVISLVFPKDGIKFSMAFTENGEIKNEEFKLKFFSLESLFEEDTIQYADITDIIDLNIIEEDTIIELAVIDSVIVPDTIRVCGDSLKKVTHVIEFAEGKSDALHPFFKHISKRSDLSRIVHYGDSQIEGDRITSFIRDKFQKKFGGSGVGLIPALDIYNCFSVDNSCSDNWKRYTVFGRKDTTVKHSRYGAMASFSRFAPINNDTVFTDTTVYEAWINLKRSSSAYNTARNFKKLRLFYGYNKKPVIAEVYKGNELLYFETMSVSNSLNVMEMNFETTPDELNIKFSGKDSPDVYAIALDNTKGIAVDNVAMRGSSGTEFRKMDYTLLTQMYKKLNVRLFILQYGGNVIPYINNEKECVNYGNWFKSQINTLKNACPNACFVVIGPSDMSKKEDGKYITYPMLEKVRDELKKAALDAGAGYWDMYSAMGGKNSMPSWVDAKPSLASSDYTHFSSRGAKIIANMFYNALINEYDKYKQSLNNKKTNDK